VHSSLIVCSVFAVDSEQKTPNPNWRYHTVVPLTVGDDDSSADDLLGREKRATGDGSGEENDDEDSDRQVMSMLAADGLVWIGGRRGDLAAFDAASRKKRFHFGAYHRDALTCLFTIPPRYAALSHTRHACACA
jgi:hypothetical protein